MKLNVRFSAIDLVEDIELEVDKDWIYSDINDAYSEWLFDRCGGRWEILDGDNDDEV